MATDILNWAKGKGHDAAINSMCKTIAAETSAQPAKQPILKTAPRYTNLSEQSQLVYRHMQRAGSISAREAMNDYGITSATLSRRVCDMEEEGFKIKRTKKTHPLTRKSYTRYALEA